MSIDLDELRAVYPDAADHIHLLPLHMHDGVARWITRGISPGGFLEAVIANELHLAVSLADDTNRNMLVEWVRFFYTHAPSECWGSLDKASAWKKRGGLLGHPEEAA